MSIGFFLDSGLSQPATRIYATAAADGSGSSDHVVWLGGADATREHVAASDPGVDPAQVSVFDAADGDSLLPSTVSLATTQGGLDTATPGASLSLGATIGGGSANAVAVWVRVDAPEIDPAIYDNLALITNALISRVA